MNINGQGKASAEWEKLRHEFITSVSPDRKSKFTKKLNEISGDFKQSHIRMPNIDTSIMELMLTGKVRDKRKTTYPYESLFRKYNGDIGGNTITGKISVIKLREGSEVIGSWSSGHGWSVSLTEAEISRQVEIGRLYNSTWQKEIRTKQA
jgi:hypothetical protein